MLRWTAGIVECHWVGQAVCVRRSCPDCDRQVKLSCKDRMHHLVAGELGSAPRSAPAENQNGRNFPEWKEALERSFLRMDNEVSGEVSTDGACKSEAGTPHHADFGSTAVVAVPDRPDELLRIQAAGGRVIHWGCPRVLGVLAMSRSIDWFLMAANPASLFTSFFAPPPSNFIQSIFSISTLEDMLKRFVQVVERTSPSNFIQSIFSISTLEDMLERFVQVVERRPPSNFIQSIFSVSTLEDMPVQVVERRPPSNFIQSIFSISTLEDMLERFVQVVERGLVFAELTWF
ncbi:putative protein phosphatase 2C 24 [Nymphaea thermarum]|nr:putative protein phosphatase 2C 24 [Nymphaea thermarum]